MWKYRISGDRLQTPILEGSVNSAILGYLSPSGNCLWAFLTLPGTVLGIQFSRFPAVSRFLLLQVWDRERTREVLAIFQDATSRPTSTLSSKMQLQHSAQGQQWGSVTGDYMVITEYEVL
jgi:hypothetical protein